MQSKRQDSSNAQKSNAVPWDRVRAWETGEYVKALGPKIEELDRVCAQTRQILYNLRRVLRR
jgi:hypothetical protein